jgi:hypothetical protein
MTGPRNICNPHAWREESGIVLPPQATVAGTLRRGCPRLGFRHQLLVERDADAVASVNHKRLLGVERVVHWPLASADMG